MGLIIYKCSAGSGKTFTLVERFLQFTIQQPALFKQILAITFTNKAAEELKSRIILELDRIASGKPSKQLKQLKIHFSDLSEAEIRTRAGQILNRLIYDYGAFSVSTIDSYFQTLARTLAREMRLPMRYAIELDHDAIGEALTDMVIDEAGKDPVITDWLREMLLDLIENDKGWEVSGQIKDMAKQLIQSADALNQVRNTDPKALLEFIRWMRDYTKEFKQEIKSIASQFIRLCDTHGITVADFKGKSKSIYTPIEKINRGDTDITTLESIQKKLVEIGGDSEKLIPTKGSKQSALSVASEFLQLIQAYQALLEEKLQNYRTCLLSLQHIWKAGIGGELDNKFKQFRQENQVFHLSDTTRMLCEAVQDQDTPFIFEKTGNTYRHIFIDEFQDTSTEQWNILKPLVINSLSNGNEVMIVGDAKQSIYRFRGGDVSLILKKVKDQIVHTGFEVESKHLENNWRSEPEVVQFNNTIFPAIARIDSLRLRHGTELLLQAFSEENVYQKTSEAAGSGAVRLRFFDPKETAITSSGDEAEDIDNGWKKQACRALSDTIEQLLLQGFRYRDITILVTKAKEEGEIAKHFVQEGKHPFIASNSLNLANSPEVLLILSAIRLIGDPGNRLLRAEIDRIKQPSVFSADLPFGSQVQEKESWALSSICKRCSHLESMPLQFAFHQLCELLDCNPSSAYIQKLNDVVLEHVASGGESLSGFIQWWDEHVETKNWSVELPAGNDAIRIMTIHASKGLEFPVVFIPFVDWGLMPKSGSLSWMEANSVPFASYGKLPVSIKKELAESHYATAFHNEILDTALDKLNMLYVAFTRAAVRLYAFASARPQANTCGKLLLETIASIPEWHQQLMANQGRSLEFGNDKPYIPKVGGEKEDPFYGPKPDPDQFSIPSKSGSEPTATPLRFKDKTEEMRIGDIIHHVLEQPDLTSTDPTRIDSILTYHADPLARGQRTHVRETILQTLNLLDQHGWNSSNYRVSAEQELCDTDSSIHRPDRVLFGKDQTIVIDFKTGNAEQSHKKQVSRYCKLIDSAGYGPAKGYLIYTSTLSVVPVE